MPLTESQASLQCSENRQSRQEQISLPLGLASEVEQARASGVDIADGG